MKLWKRIFFWKVKWKKFLKGKNSNNPRGWYWRPCYLLLGKQDHDDDTHGLEKDHSHLPEPTCSASQRGQVLPVFKHMSRAEATNTSRNVKKFPPALEAINWWTELLLKKNSLKKSSQLVVVEKSCLYSCS